MRLAKDSDFFIDLPDVGVFRFGRRTFLDRARIRADYLRIVKDMDDEDKELAAYASIMATHKVLCVEAPAGWQDIDSMELDDEMDNQIFSLYDKVRAQEDLFRRGPDKGVEASG